LKRFYVVKSIGEWVNMRVCSDIPSLLRILPQWEMRFSGQEKLTKWPRIFIWISEWLSYTMVEIRGWYWNFIYVLLYLLRRKFTILWFCNTSLWRIMNIKSTIILICNYLRLLCFICSEFVWWLKLVLKSDVKYRAFLLFFVKTKVIFLYW